MLFIRYARLQAIYPLEDKNVDAHSNMFSMHSTSSVHKVPSGVFFSDLSSAVCTLIRIECHNQHLYGCVHAQSVLVLPQDGVSSNITTTTTVQVAIQPPFAGTYSICEEDTTSAIAEGQQTSIGRGWSMMQQQHVINYNHHPNQTRTSTCAIGVTNAAINATCIGAHHSNGACQMFLVHNQLLYPCQF